MKMTLNESAILDLIAEFPTRSDMTDLRDRLRSELRIVADVILGAQTQDLHVKKVAAGFISRNRT